MPIFEYLCGKCGKRFEKIVTNSAVKNILCPECGSENVKKQLSTFAAVSGGNKSACPDAGACAARTSGGCCGGCGCSHHHG